MALTRVSGRVVYPHGEDTPTPVTGDGVIEYVHATPGIIDGAVHGPDRKRIGYVAGVAEDAWLKPGMWRAYVYPDEGRSYTLHLGVPEDGETTIADAVGESVPDGLIVKGDPGPPGASVTGGRDNGDGTVSFELSDGTYTDPVAVPPGPAGRGISSISDPDADSRVTITFTDGSETTVQAVRGAKGDRGTDSTVPGPPPTVSWSGDRLVVGGVQGPPLTGPQGAGGVPETAFSAGIENKAIDLPFATFVTVPFGAAGVKSNVGGGIWWPNESEWTVPATGVYTIVATVRIADSSTARSVGIGVHTSNVDFSDFIWGNQGGIQRDTRMYSRIARLNAGDRMRLYIRSESGYNLKAASLSIARIS